MPGLDNYKIDQYALDGGRLLPGDIITDNDIIRLGDKGSGKYIWGKTDVQAPYGITTDDQGNVYVAYAASSGKKVRKLNSDGAEIWANSDAVENAYSVAVDAQGNVYVASNYTNKAVRKLNSNGVEIWSTTDRTANAIALDNAGNIYAAFGTGSINVKKYNPSGVVQWTLNETNATAIAVDDKGDVYVGGAYGIVKVSTSNATEIWRNSAQKPGYGVALDGKGYVYVAYNVSSGDRVSKLDASTGNKIWGDTDQSSAYAIAADRYGNCYVGYNILTGNGKGFKKINPYGAETWSISNRGSTRGIAVDSAGFVYTVHAISGDEVRKTDGNVYYEVV